jgi:alpha-galactosidase
MERILRAGWVAWVVLSSAALRVSADESTNAAIILTPKSSAMPRINGPKIFGVRPGSSFLYSIPATGARPMTFAVDHFSDVIKNCNL